MLYLLYGYCFAISSIVRQLLRNNFKLKEIKTPTRTDISPSNDSCLSTKCENFTPRLAVAPSFPFSPSVPVVAEGSHLKTPYPGYVVHGWLESRRSCVSGFAEGAVRRGETSERASERANERAGEQVSGRAPYASHVCGFINWVRRWGFFY